MKLYNPTEHTVSIVIKGKGFTINPMGTSVEMKESEVTHWLGIHGFLLVSDEATPKTPVLTIKEVITDIIKEETPILEEEVAVETAEVVAEPKVVVTPKKK